MAQPHARPGEIVKLQPLGAALETEKTIAIVKSEEFEAVRLIVRAGSTIPPHKIAGALTLHCLEGRVTLDLAQKSLELSGGDWVYLLGDEVHSLRGLRDSSLLLTIMFRS